MGALAQSWSLEQLSPNRGVCPLTGEWRKVWGGAAGDQASPQGEQGGSTTQLCAQDPGLPTPGPAPTSLSPLTPDCIPPSQSWIPTPGPGSLLLDRGKGHEVKYLGSTALERPDDHDLTFTLFVHII